MFIGASDMRMARNAWRWLGRGRLLGGPAYAGLACGGEGDSVQGAACCIGLRRARQIIDGGMAEVKRPRTSAALGSTLMGGA